MDVEKVPTGYAMVVLRPQAPEQAPEQVPEQAPEQVPEQVPEQHELRWAVDSTRGKLRDRMKKRKETAHRCGKQCNLFLQIHAVWKL